MTNKKEIEDKAELLWGKDLHVKKNAPIHCNQLEEIFKDKWNKSLKGNLLEIGCGSGSDLYVFSKINSLNHITSIDLGANVDHLATKYVDRIDIDVKQGNALSLPFDDDKFDIIYSFGVFHHSADPVKCISEANRVLKQRGRMFLYLYSSHEDIFIKRMGIILEKVIMKFLRVLPYSLQNLICILLSPICWLVFSAPSFIIKMLGFKSLSKKFPFYFGTHPFSLINDLKDRLMAPINFRFKKDEMEKILSSFNFNYHKIIKTASGLYIYCEK